MNDIKKKSMMLSVIVLLMGLMIVGGTYAFLYVSANITNTNYVGVSTCFLVDYNIDNGDNTESITGTLFPSLGPTDGLNGRVGLKINDECSVNGTGTLKIHLNNGTSASLIQKATSHCEDKKTGDILTEYTTESTCTSSGGKWRDYPNTYCEDNDTLQVLKDYTTSASCTANNGTWVTNGSPLKYAIYNSTNINASPAKVGHITSSTGDITIYDDIILTQDQRYFYIYIWLDGYLTDNSHADLTFDGYIKANAIQSDDLLPSIYKQVEYIENTGTQYIDTGYYLLSNNIDIQTKIYTQNMPTSEQDIISNQDGSSGRFVLGLYNYTVFGYSRDATTSDTNVTSTTYSGEATFEIDMNYNSSSHIKTLTVNGNTTTKTQTATIANSNQTLKLFKAGNSNSLYFIGKMYYFKLYVDNNLIWDLIPCYRVSDNVRGLYDIVNNKFYTNAGTGTFGIPS